MKSFALVCVVFSLGAAAYGSLLYGVTSTGSIGSDNSYFPDQTWNFGPGTVTRFASPVLAATGSYTVTTSTFDGSATAWTSSNGGSLHGYASGTSGTCSTCSSFPSTGGGFSIEWSDTIYVAGLPSATPVQILLTDALNSFTTITVGGETSVESVVALGGQSLQVVNDQGSADGLAAQSVLIQTTSGSTLQLTETLDGSVSVHLGESATVDASDTANAFLTVLTPGASYTSASGVGYAEAPEPRAFWLAMAALLGMRAARSRLVLFSGQGRRQ